MLLSIIYSLSSFLTLVAANGFVTLPITRQLLNSTTGMNPILNAKALFIPDVLKYSPYIYQTTFKIGSDQQEQTALIDTGSSDLWVYQNSSGVPNGFNVSSSSTAKYVNDEFSIGYVDGSTAKGDYYTDQVIWGSANVNFQFGVSNSTSGSGSGVFGISFEAGEAHGPYDNYPVALKNQGFIEKIAYSLYLDSGSDQGSILFGAVDTSQYTGTLKEVNITSTSSLNVDFEVAGHQLNGILDSGTSFTYIPDDALSDLAKSLNATYNSNESAYEANGSIDGSSVTYSFGGVNVTVPGSEVWVHKNNEGNSWFLNILPSSQVSNYIILGDNFLRSAYVVYDLEDKKIAIAQANLSPGVPNYQVIGSSGIPGAQ